MSGEIEAAGALATASAMASAIEGREPGQAGEGGCPNCGVKIEGRFCANCGQATHGRRSLFHVVEEVLHNIFHLDTKLWRTLPLAIFRPGTLTRNYVYGKRARYISPLALFLFSIFLMFFAFSFLEAPVEMAGTPEQQRAAMLEELEASRGELAEAERELAAARLAPAPTNGAPPDLDVRMAELDVRLARDELTRDENAIARIDRLIARRAAEAAGSDIPAELTEEEGEIDGVGWRAGETWQDGVRRMAQREDFVVIQGMPELNERVRRRFANPDLALYSIQEAGSKFSFLLAPLSLPFLMLLFLWKRGVTLYDHIVFALYALSFAALLFVAIILTAQHAWTSWMTGWLFMTLPVHMYFQIGGAYALGRWSALWRTFFMLIFASIILSIFLVLIVILGLAG